MPRPAAIPAAQQLCERIVAFSDYAPDWYLTEQEVAHLADQVEAALATTNGDTGPVTVTARQLALLLRCHQLGDAA